MSDAPAQLLIAGTAVTLVIALVLAGIIAGRSIGRGAEDRETDRADAMERTTRMLLGLVGHHLTEEQAAAVASELDRYARKPRRAGRHAAGSDPQ